MGERPAMIQKIDKERLHPFASVHKDRDGAVHGVTPKGRRALADQEEMGLQAPGSTYQRPQPAPSPASTSAPSVGHRGPGAIPAQALMPQLFRVDTPEELRGGQGRARSLPPPALPWSWADPTANAPAAPADPTDMQPNLQIVSFRCVSS